MPRGRPKKTTIEVLPPEDNQSQSRQKLVEAKHRIEYTELRPVEDDSAEESAEEDLDFVEEEKAKKRRKTAKDERDDFRRELDKLGVASVSRLKLSIDKYRHSDSDDSGTLAEKDFCTKYPVTKDHILSDDYLDVARKYGAGRYWFTLRMDNKIVRQWERAINATVSPSAPVIQNAIPGDPTSPQFIIQTNGDGQQQQPYQPMSMRDMMKAQRESLKEELEFRRLLMESYGMAPNQQEAQQQSRSEEEVLAGAILKQPEVIENVVGSVLKRFGKGGSGDDEPGWSTVVMEAVKNNQIASSIQALGNVALMFLDRFLPSRGNQHGQAQMAQTPPQNQTQPDRQQVLSIPTQQAPSDQSLQPSAATAPNMGSGGTIGEVERLITQTPLPVPTALDLVAQGRIASEDLVFSKVIANCQRQISPQSTLKWIWEFADSINEEMPDLSIDGYIKDFAKTAPEAVIEYIKSLPGGEQIASLPHAKEWCAELQKLIKEQEGE